MKILGFEFPYGKHFLTKPKESWVVVDTSLVKNYYSSLTTYECCPAEEFESEEQAINYVKNSVAKSHWNHTRIYKEIKPELE